MYYVFVTLAILFFLFFIGIMSRYIKNDIVDSFSEQKKDEQKKDQYKFATKLQN